MIWTWRRIWKKFSSMQSIRRRRYDVLIAFAGSVRGGDVLSLITHGVGTGDPRFVFSVI
jgi:hypothetical protein